MIESIKEFYVILLKSMNVNYFFKSNNENYSNVKFININILIWLAGSEIRMWATIIKVKPTN